MPESNPSQARPAPLNRQNHLGTRAPNASPAASLNALAVQRALDTTAGEAIDLLGREVGLRTAKKAEEARARNNADGDLGDTSASPRLGGRAARRAANVLGDENKNVAFEARSNAYGQAVVRTDDKMARRIQKFARSVQNKSVLPEQQQNIRRVAGRKKLSSRTQRL